MKFWLSTHTTGSKSLKKQLHTTKLTQMVNWHRHSSDSWRTQNWKRYMKAHDKPLYEQAIIDYNRMWNLDFEEQLTMYQWFTKDYVDWILDFDVNNFLDTETFWIIDFSKIKDDYLKKRNMEFFMILDDVKEISLKKFNNQIASDTLVVIEYVVDWKLKDYRTIPLAILSNLLQIEDKSYELILKQFMTNFWYKIKEKLEWKKHYRWLQNAT